MGEHRTIGAGEAGRVTVRSFAAMPDAADARLLLAEIASASAAPRPHITDAPIILYGAGNLGRMAKEFLETVGRPFESVVDRNAPGLRDDPCWRSHALMTAEAVPDEIKQTHALLVTVATAPFAPVEAELRQRGFAQIVPFYDFAEGFRDIHPLSNGWFAAPFSHDDLAMIVRVQDGFSDDLSRAHHLQFLAWRRLRQEWTFSDAPVTGDDRFFIPEIMAVLHDDEVFVDAGAHHGSVVEAFLSRVDRRFAGIIAVEPDAANRDRLKAALGGMVDRDKVEIHDVALGSETGEGRFHSGLGYASQLSATGHEIVAVHRIADLVAGGPPVTFLKLHLEGAELDALKGARETLLHDRPIVAATVYHNDDGIWRTPLWLMETLDNYRFLFRLHSWCGTGAVIYAIPQERLP